MKKITLLLLLMTVFAGNAKNPQESDDPCFKPTSLTVMNVSLIGATILWTESGEATAWEVLVVPMGTPIPTADMSGMEAVGAQEFTIINLLPCTYYTVYVRSNCGDTFSDWAGGYNFVTLSSGSVDTFNEGFEDALENGMPTCWSAVLNGNTLSEFASVKTVLTNPYEGTKALQLLNHSSGNDSNVLLVSPNLANLQAGTHRLRFQARTGFNAGNLEIGTVTEATSEAQFTVVDAVDLTDNYAEYIINFDEYAGEDTYIALRHNSSLYSTILLDNIVWEAIPLCADVSDILINDTTTNSVTLSWTSNGNETAWDIVYGPTSVSDPATLVPITPSATTNEGAVVTGLLENIAYHIWVRSVCESDENGYWIGPIAVTTSCQSVATFEEDFDTTAVDTLPLCWSAVLSGESLSETSYVKAFDGFAHSGTTSIRLNNTDSGADANVILASPKLSTLSAATHRLKLWASGNGGSTILQIGTLNNNTADAVFTPFESFSLGEQFQYIMVDFSNYSDNDKYIALRNASTSDYTSIFIDDVIWEPIPQCEDVSGIEILDLTTTSATITWVPGSSIPGWQVAYGLATITNPDLATVSEVVTDTAFLVENLEVGTSYNVWVRSVCEGNNGNWMGPVLLNTECNPVASFSENFDASSTNLPVCWNPIVSGAWEGSAIALDTFSFTSAPNGVLLYGAYSGAGSEIMLISPPVSTLAEGSYELKFKASGSHQIEIGTLDGNTIDAAFTLFNTVIPSDFGPQSFTVDFASYTGTDSYIGFRLKTDGENSYAVLDDITWSSALSSGGFDKEQFSFYPNPVKEVLNINYQDAITNIAVFNMLGQKVMESKANSTSVKMDMSALSSGSYVVKVSTNDQVKSIKVIKQ